MKQSSPAAESDLRRRLVLALSILLLLISAGLTWQFGTDSTSRFIASATGRVGLVLGALWLAWDSLRKPAAWLPPGIAVAGVIALAIVAVQPRLAFLVAPAIGGLITIASIVRAMR